MQNNQKEIILIKDLGLIQISQKSKEKRRFGLYKCYCGNEFKVQHRFIKEQKTKSCGCLNIQRIKERRTTHGLSSHPIYSVWNDMIKRCTNKNNEYYKDYGERNITVCNEWLNVQNFINDMYPSYVNGLSLDREDNNLGYSKSNCRWTTKDIQSRNTRKIRSTNTTGYRGIGISGKKFTARICVNYNHIHIGIYNTAIEAAKAYDNYIIENNLEHTKNF